MRCDKCRHEIGPEQKRCPNCGAVNKFALQHKKNMRKFEENYASTEKEVKEYGRSVEGLGKRAAILAALLVGSIVMIIAAAIADSDPDEKAAAKRDSAKNAAAYAEEADGYLERGEYMEYVSFLYAHELMNFPPEEFDRFNSVHYVAGNYYECIKRMEIMILRSDDPEYYDGLDTDIRNFCLYVDTFYETFEAQKNSEKNEKYLGYIMDMEAELRAAMRTYLSISEEEMQEFIDSSRGLKAVRVWEVLRHE